jgi:hypothetical protein
VPLRAALAREADKHRKYADICAVNDYTAVPFVVESNGGLAPDAQKLLTLLSKHSHDLTPRQWLAHAYNVVSVVLQSANARLAQGGMQSHNIDRTRWQRKNNGQLRYAQRVRRHRWEAAESAKSAPTSAHSIRRTVSVRLEELTDAHKAMGELPTQQSECQYPLTQPLSAGDQYATPHKRARHTDDGGGVPAKRQLCWPSPLHLEEVASAPEESAELSPARLIVAE